MSGNLKKRNSSVELLRIFALFSIILSHLIGGGKQLSGVNLYYAVFANTFFNAGTGVLIFMLITGYFGAHLTQKRFNHAYSIIYVSSLFLLAFRFVFSTVELKETVYYLLPVTMRHSWYASCYIFTLLLSPFFDKIIEKADRKTYTRFVIVAIGLFYVIPTFFYYDIANDRGKGLINMVLAYFIGAYLRKYPPESITNKTLALTAAGSLLFSFAGNIAATLVRHGECSYPFSRDCTVTVLLVAAPLLLLAVRKERHISAVNFVSGYVFYMFLTSPNSLAKVFYNVSKLSDRIVYIPATFISVIAGLCLSFAVALILQFPAKLLQKILEIIESFIYRLINEKPMFRKIKNLWE